MVLCAHLRDFRNYHEHTNQEHTRRLANQRPVGVRDALRQRGATYETGYLTLQEDAGRQTLGHALHLAIPFDDYGLCLVLLSVRPYTISVHAVHSETEVWGSTQGTVLRGP
jgi:hypothetical protein